MFISHEGIIRALADQMTLVLGRQQGQIALPPSGVPGFALQTSNLKDGPPVALMYVFGEPFVKVLGELAHRLKDAIEAAERQSHRAQDN